MRKITQDAINAFMNGKTFNRDNTNVINLSSETILCLHGSDIAVKNRITGKIIVRNAGWFSNTTKERLNGIPGVSINQRKGIWYLNGEPWAGQWFTITEGDNV